MDQSLFNSYMYICIEWYGVYVPIGTVICLVLLRLVLIISGSNKIKLHLIREFIVDQEAMKLTQF